MLKAFYRVPIVPSSYSSIIQEIAEKQASGELIWKPEETSSAGDNVTYFDNDDDFLDGGVDKKVFDPSVEMYPQPYCSIVDTFAETCFEDSILGVNFTYNLRAVYRTEMFCHSFYVLSVWICNFLLKGNEQKS